MRVVVVGLGGIGKSLAEPLCRTLVFSKSQRTTKRVILIDGDAYEEKNRQRQRFQAFSNKAEETSEALVATFPELEIEFKPHYVDNNNIFLFIKDGDVVFLGVDNHATRKLVSDHAQSLKNVLLISGGNETHDGNVQICERRNDKQVAPPLIWQHPEIENPNDRNPADVACGELVAQGATQLLAVNLTIAALMLNAYTLWLDSGQIPYREIYFDLRTGNVRPVRHSS